MNDDGCVLISVFDPVQGVVVKHPVTFNINRFVAANNDSLYEMVLVYKDYEERWRTLLPADVLDTIVEVEMICEHTTALV